MTAKGLTHFQIYDISRSYRQLYYFGSLGDINGGLKVLSAGPGILYKGNRDEDGPRTSCNFIRNFMNNGVGDYTLLLCYAILNYRDYLQKGQS